MQLFELLCYDSLALKKCDSSFAKSTSKNSDKNESCTAASILSVGCNSLVELVAQVVFSDLLNGNSSCRMLDTVMHKIVRAFFPCGTQSWLQWKFVARKWYSKVNYNIHSHEFYPCTWKKGHIYMSKCAKYIYCQIVWQRNLLTSCRKKGCFESIRQLIRWICDLFVP